MFGQSGIIPASPEYLIFNLYHFCCFKRRVRGGERRGEERRKQKNESRQREKSTWTFSVETIKAQLRSTLEKKTIEVNSRN